MLPPASSGMAHNGTAEHGQNQAEGREMPPSGLGCVSKCLASKCVGLRGGGAGEHRCTL